MDNLDSNNTGKFLHDEFHAITLSATIKVVRGFICICTYGLKCQLSGDAPQSSWSSINDV